MTTQISADNIQPSTLASISGGPKISNIQVTNSSYVVLDDTAVALTGGYIKITGSGFASGCTVIINGTAATSVSFISSSELNAQVGPQNAGTYIVYVTNTDGSTAIRVNGITYSGTPTWVTGSTLPDSQVDSSISIQLSATGDSSITYALQSGSTLPTGLSLTSGGLLSGIISGLTTETVYNFTVEAIDAQYQESPRAFSITITVGDEYWKYVTTLLSASSPTTLPFNDDASTNNFPMSIVGDVRPFNFNPYTPGYYSNYFDGSGDYLRLPVNAAFNIGSGDYTWECWVNMTTIGTNKMLYSNGMTTGTLGIGLGMSTADRLTVFRNGVAFDFIGSTTIPLKQWVHLAVTKSSGTTKFWINGVNTDTFGTNYTYTDPTDNISIGRRGTNSEDPNGYISNLRLVKGVAVYASNFTPPTSPLTAITNTSLLTCQSNRFIDNSTNNFTITKYGETLVSSFIPYTPNSSYSTYGSTYFDGSGDFLSTPTGPAAFDFTSTKTLTLEFWAYSLTWGGTNFNFFDIQEAQPFRVLYNGSTLAWQSTSAGTNIITAAVTIPINTWVHYAFVRNNDTLYMFVNGTQVATGSYSNNWPSTAAGNVRIGCNRGDTWFVNGYMTDVRLVKGTALYTSNFTPPTTPLTAISGTSLLTCQSNQPVANNTFLDKSTSDFAITRVGNTTQGTFSPYGAGYSVYFPNASYMNSLSTAGAFTSIPNTTNFDLGTGDFTMEGWIYPMQLPSGDTWPTNYQNTSSLFGRGTPSTADGYNLVLGATKLLFQSADTLITSGTHNIVIGNWYHVAVSRTSGTLQLFVNGVSVASVSYSSSPGAGSNFYIGCETGQGAYFYGYMSNVRLVKGTGLYSSTFTPSSTPLQAVAGTQLLTNQSPSYVDNSPNNYVVTGFNIPSIQRFSPFAGTTLPTPYYSAYFDGSGDYLSMASNAMLNLETGDFTVEFWAYPTSTATDFFGISATGSGGFFVGFSSSGTVGWGWGRNAVAWDYRVASSATINTWQHVAVSRSGTSMRLFVNGVQQGTTQTNSTSYDLSATSTTVGSQGANYYLTGSLSNLRVVKGTAVYTANFTPPTAPLTAISGTSLLTCQSNTFIDNSTNNFTITANGNATPKQISPFTLTYSTGQSYTPSVFGGSMYFDGSGDYLSTSNSILAMGTASFTMEAWVYWTGGSGSYRQLFSTRTTTGSSTAQGSLAVTPGNALIWWTSSAIITTSATLQQNSWNHVALVRNGTALAVYLNGVSVGTATNSDNLTASVFSIGANNDGSEPFTGYLSDVRVTKNVAVYTSNFTPLNAPLTAIKNSVYLVNGANAAIYDSSECVVLETVGDTKLNTVTTKFSGTTSMYFDGTGDYLTTPYTPNLAFGTGDFTIECWYNSVGNGTYSGPFQHAGAAPSNAGQFRCWTRYNSGNQLGFTYSNGGGGWVDINAGTNVNDSAWHHLVWSRAAGTLRIFVDGTVVNTTTGLTQSLGNSSYPFNIAYNAFDNAYMIGYISDFRITKGYARYTANFTPPAIPFSTK